MKSKYTTIPVFIRYFKNNNNDDKIFSSAYIGQVKNNVWIEESVDKQVRLSRRGSRRPFEDKCGARAFLSKFLMFTVTQTNLVNSYCRKLHWELGGGEKKNAKVIFHVLSLFMIIGENTREYHLIYIKFIELNII